MKKEYTAKVSINDFVYKPTDNECHKSSSGHEFQAVCVNCGFTMDIYDWEDQYRNHDCYGNSEDL